MKQQRIQSDRRSEASRAASRDSHANAQASPQSVADHSAPVALPVHALSRLLAPMPQAKLTVSQPGDRLEREADAAADRVMGGALRTSAPAAPDDAAGGALQRRSQQDGANVAHVASPANTESTASLDDAGSTRSHAISVESRLAGLHGGGAPLAGGLREFYESWFGRDFSSVRVHTGDRAAETARSLRARAFTYGRDVVFGAGEFSPGTDAGRHLIAHELAHVVQQGAAAPTQVMRKASYGTKGDGENEKEGPTPSVTIAESEVTDETDETEESATPDVQREALPDVRRDGHPDVQREAAPDIQRDTLPGDEGTSAEAPVAEAPPGDGGAIPAQTPPAGPAQPPASPPPAVATPTLTVTPGATLVRGSSLTATVGFTPAAGETMTISDWKYTTTDHGDVTRPATDPTFQTSWAGTMALSGTLEVTYAITPAGGTAGADQTLSQAIAVSDRTGSTWTAQVVEGREGALTGKPSPPQVFSDLGLHNGLTPGLTLRDTPITAGPNTGLSFVGSLGAGNFESNPLLHPDLRARTSRFKTFHSVPSRLYMVRNGVKTLVPGTAYSGLTTSPSLTFTVPDWEAFYKARDFYIITASFNGVDVQLQPAWWGLDPNAEDGTIQIRDDAAIRTALNITDPADRYTTSVDGASWSGFQLMQAAAIVAGTQSHEYLHATHSHRANFRKMIRALDPPKLLEKSISSATTTVDFATRLSTLMSEIIEPDHELVDEAASATAEEFVAAPGSMAGVNTNPDTGAFLGSVWDITNDDEMS